MMALGANLLLLLAILGQEGPQTAMEHYSLGQSQAMEGKFEEAKGSYARATELDPTSPWPHYGRAEILWKEGRPNKAIEVVSRAIELGEQDLGGLRLYHLLRGTIQFELGLLDKAEADLKTVMASDATVPRAHDLLAQIYLLKNEYDKAMKEGFALVSLEKDVDDGYYLIGKALFKKGKLEGARKVLRKSTDLNPRHVKARYTLAQVLMRLGRKDEAQKELELHNRLQAVQEQLEHALDQGPYGKCVHCWRVLSIAYGELGRFDEALFYARKVLKARADEPEALFVLGYCQSELGDYGGAIKTYSKSIGVMPEYVPPYNNLAWLLATVEEVRDPDEAVRLAEKTVELGGALPQVLAEAYFSRGDGEKALTVLQDAIDKDHPESSRYQKRIQRFRESGGGSGAGRPPAVPPPSRPKPATEEPHDQK